MFCEAKLQIEPKVRSESDVGETKKPIFPTYNQKFLSFDWEFIPKWDYENFPKNNYFRLMTK
jgi:hypothetical protein